VRRRSLRLRLALTYASMALLTALILGGILLGVLAMRWNVVMGGQFFSKSLRGVMSYKLEFAGAEGWFLGLILLSLPFIILTVLIHLFLSQRLPTSGHVPHRLETK